jgi:hypothetical protein
MVEQNQLDQLAKLLSLLKANGITSFKKDGLELVLEKPEPSGPSLADHLAKDKCAEEAMPVDLRTDNINSHETLLNWSAPPSAQEAVNPPQSIPGTGDEAL